MKLESLKSLGFEVISNESMLYVVGGTNVRCDGICTPTKEYSNDYVGGDGITHIPMSGANNDFSEAYLDRVCDAAYPGWVEPEDPLYPEFLEDAEIEGEYSFCG